jgi:hypothetical protein
MSRLNLFLNEEEINKDDDEETQSSIDGEEEQPQMSQEEVEDQYLQNKVKELKDRDTLIHSKLGRILATPDELEQLDKERDEAKKEELENKKLDENSRKDLIDSIKKKGFEYASQGVWVNKSGKRGRITKENTWEPIDDTKKPSDKKHQLNGVQKKIILTSKRKSELDKKAEEIVNKEKQEKGLKKEKEKNLKKKKTVDDAVIIDGRDKTLSQKINTSKEKAFTIGLYDEEKGDKKFYEQTKNYKGKDISIKNKWKIPSWVSSSDKIPKSELQTFERMMNTKKVSQTEPPVSFFTGGKSGGAGKIQSQAGELMSMITTSMSKNDRKLFEKNVLEHISTIDEKSSIITKDWVKASVNNAEAIHKRIQKEYNVDDASSIITHVCWDTKDGVEALGLSDYNKNKGFSSDIYVKLKTKSGKKILNEISLKKDKNVFLFNSTTTMLKKWDRSLPEDIDVNIYSENLKKTLIKGVDKQRINQLLLKSKTPAVQELQNLIYKYGKENIDDFMSCTNRKDRNVLLVALRAQEEHGDTEATKHLKSIEKSSKDYSINCIKSFETNKKLKKGMLSEIKNNFPLKSIIDNEETMAIGDMSVDKKVVSKIFGTDNWDEIQENLIVVTDKTPPYLEYKVKGKKENIPIAIINIREDGVGFGSKFKFEMALDKRFSKLLKDANNEIYGQMTNESVFTSFILNVDFNDYLDD